MKSDAPSAVGCPAEPLTIDNVYPWGRSFDEYRRMFGLSATLEEWLNASEYILKEGNEAVMLCERGIRTFETAYRFTLDLTAVPVLKQLTHLPIIVDPSHAAGKRDLVEPLSLAAAAVGADGIIVEVHHDPEAAICDGPQAVPADDFGAYVEQVQRVAETVGNELSAL